MSNIIKVSVKWGKKKLDDIELNLAESPSVFKTQVFSLTGVLPERQKIMVKGGILKDDADWSKLGVKDGHVFMLMGSAETDIPKEPVQKPVFVEDLPEEQASSLEIGLPSGLQNLGNTCYMNATLQCLKTVPELQVALKKYPGKTKENDMPNNLTVELRELYAMLEHSNQPYPPIKFLQNLRVAFPQFAQKGQNGTFMQQDAEECWNQLLLSLSQRLPKYKDGGLEEQTPNLTLSNSAIGQLFSGDTTSSIKNTENPDESEMKVDTFSKLSCHISATTNFLIEGLKQGMEETFSKRSAALGKECAFQKSSKISKLPYYLTIQFVRFFWKQDKQLKAKISRPVEYPFTLDLYDLCTDDLKKHITPKRKALQELEEKKLQAYAQKMKEHRGNKEEIKKDNKQEKKSIDAVNPATLINETGMYELIAVLTHKGRSADSGHYVAWVKEDDDRWLKYDDDIVSVVNNEEIKKLSGKGGSDWHTAYLCLYKTKTLEDEPMQVESTTTTTTTTTTTSTNQ